MQMLSSVEDFIATDLNQTNYKLRSDQRVLEKYSEVTQSDSHWRTFETFDDFIIDQISDCQAYFDSFIDQEKLKAKCVSLKQVLDQKTEQYTQIEKRSVGVQRARQAKLENDQAEVAYMEANLTYNITIINCAYESIAAFRQERRQ